MEEEKRCRFDLFSSMEVECQLREDMAACTWLQELASYMSSEAASGGGLSSSGGSEPTSPFLLFPEIASSCVPPCPLECEGPTLPSTEGSEMDDARGGLVPAPSPRSDVGPTSSRAQSPEAVDPMPPPTDAPGA